MRDDRKVVEALFDQEPNDTVGIENEVRPGGVFVADHGEQRNKLRRLWEDVHIL